MERWVGRPNHVQHSGTPSLHAFYPIAGLINALVGKVPGTSPPMERMQCSISFKRKDMADHLFHRELGFLDDPQRGFGGVVVGGEAALQFDLVPDQLVHQHRRHGGVAGQAAEHHGRLTVQAVHRFQDRIGIARHVDDDIAELAVGFLADHFDDIFFLDVDDPRRAEFLGQIETRLVAADAGDEDFRRAGMFGREGAGKSLLAGSLDQEHNHPS